MAVLASESETIARRPALDWLTQAPAEAKRTLLAASGGWLLDSFDVMLYALVLPAVMKDLAISKSTAGVIGSATLVAAAAGGLLFGALADTFGRAFALRWSVLLYALFTAACGLAQNAAELLLFRVLLGLGMGGEWASGAALVSETWPERDRGKALGLMQSSWAIGYGLAALTTGVLLPLTSWRAVFFVGIVPAFMTMWIRRRIPESEAWLESSQRPGRVLGKFRELFSKPLARQTTALTLMNSCALFAWWGFNLWIPAYLSLPEAQGGIGVTPRVLTTLLVVMQIAMWLGYVSFGFVSDRFGRKRSYVVYLLAAAGCLLVYGHMRSVSALLVVGSAIAFFGTGHFTGFGAVTAETYESRIRATGQGFAYNMGRIASAAAPFAVGSLAQTRGFGTAFSVISLAFTLAALLWITIRSERFTTDTPRRSGTW